jgi:hypothetical protein
MRRYGSVAFTLCLSTGTLGVVSDALLETGPEPPADADLDGMADSWEAAHGLDASDATDGAADRDADGYSNLEEYINELAEEAIGE